MRIAITISLGVLVFTLAMLANVIHYGVKIMLRRRGYRVSFFWQGFFREIRFLREVIENERDPVEKLRYRKVLYAYVSASVLFVWSGLLLIQVM